MLIKLTPRKSKPRQPPLDFSQPVEHPPRQTLKFNCELAVRAKEEGNIFGCQGQVLDALGKFSQALKYDPEKGSVYMEAISQLFLLKDDYFRAVKSAEMAVKLDPDYVPAHWTLGRALLSFGELSGAIRELRISKILAEVENKESSIILQIQGELDQALALEEKLKDREGPRAFNERLFGEMFFYETGVPVDHANDELFSELRGRQRPLCCRAALECIPEEGMSLPSMSTHRAPNEKFWGEVLAQESTTTNEDCSSSNGL